MSLRDLDFPDGRICVSTRLTAASADGLGASLVDRFQKGRKFYSREGHGVGDVDQREGFVFRRRRCGRGQMGEQKPGIGQQIISLGSGFKPREQILLGGFVTRLILGFHCEFKFGVLIR